MPAQRQAMRHALQYSGRENDGSGLHFYRARFYSSKQQRFISEDPVGLTGGMNFYSYVGNQPTRFRDPLGLKPSENFGRDPNPRCRRGTVEVGGVINGSAGPAAISGFGGLLYDGNGHGRLFWLGHWHWRRTANIRRRSDRLFERQDDQ